MSWHPTPTDTTDQQLNTMINVVYVALQIDVVQQIAHSFDAIT